MLQRSDRLRSSRDIMHVYRQGRFGAAGSLQVKTLHRPERPTVATVVISKKVAKKAVDRNAARRRLFALLQRHWETLRPGCAIVVTVRSEVASLSPVELEKQLLSALDRSSAVRPMNRKET